MFTALVRELTLTTAWARLNLEERGWFGIVCLSKVTAQARTRGARLVCSVVEAISSSVAVVVGRVSDSSMAEGASASLIRGFAVDGLERLLGEGVGGASEDRFLVTRLAAERMPLACFSSGKMVWIFVTEVFERDSGLVRFAACRSLTLLIAVAKGTFASCARKLRRDWISAFVGMMQAMAYSIEKMVER